MALGISVLHIGDCCSSLFSQPSGFKFVISSTFENSEFFCRRLLWWSLAETRPAKRTRARRPAKPRWPKWTPACLRHTGEYLTDLTVDQWCPCSTNINLVDEVAMMLDPEKSLPLKMVKQPAPTTLAPTTSFSFILGIELTTGTSFPVLLSR